MMPTSPLPQSIWLASVLVMLAPWNPSHADSLPTPAVVVAPSHLAFQEALLGTWIPEVPPTEMAPPEGEGDSVTENDDLLDLEPPPIGPRYLHAGPTAYCPHEIIPDADQQCIEVDLSGRGDEVETDPDEEKRHFLRWNPTSGRGDVILNHWRIYYDEVQGVGTDSLEGPRVVGSVQLEVVGPDTVLVLAYSLQAIGGAAGAPQAKSFDTVRMVHRPEDPLHPSLDRVWFEGRRQAASASAEIVVPRPMRCLVASELAGMHAGRPGFDWIQGVLDSCLVGVGGVEPMAVVGRRGDTARGWRARDSSWSMVHRLDAPGLTGLEQVFQMAKPPHFDQMIWQRCDSAFRAAARFVDSSGGSWIEGHERSRFHYDLGVPHCAGSGEFLDHAVKIRIRCQLPETPKAAPRKARQRAGLGHIR